MWCQNPKKEFHLERTFLIHIEKQIVMRKMAINSPHLRCAENKYIDFEFAYFELIRNEKVKSFGLKLSKGNEVIIIFGDYQEWIPLMRPYIIQLSFTQQYEILNKNEFFYSIKCLLNNCEYPALFIEKKSENCLEQLFQNIKQVRKLENQNNILGVHELFESRKHFIVVFENFSFTSLTAPLTEEQLQNISFQILQTLQTLHENNMVHGNLNPRNVLIKGDRIKLILICKNIDPNYIEPENNEQKSDIYSLGLLLLYCLQGQIPISELSYNELHCLIAQQIYKLNHVSLDCQFFLQEILQRNPDNRLSVEQALRHYWFKSKKKKELTISIVKQKRVQSMKTIGSLSPIKLNTPKIRITKNSRLVTEPRQYQYKI